MTNQPTTASATAPRSERAPLGRLMADYVDGDPHSFTELHARLSPRLRARMSRFLKDHAMVDDLVQLAFMRAHQARGQFSAQGRDPDQAVEAWYVAIARNVALDHLRRQYRRDRRHDAFGRLERATEAAFDPESWALEDERVDGVVQQVRDALEQLPASQREVVFLHKLRGLSMSEISERLGVRPGALRVRAHRAYKTLARLLAPEQAETPA